LYPINRRRPRMAGGSHTNFDTAAFSIGAIDGAATLAGALAAGIANLRPTRDTDYLSWTADTLRRALRLSELFRALELEQVQVAVDTIADRDRTIADLTRQLKVERARNARR
jgi:hypothetical protein